jgi:hypothetical protein
MPNAARDNDHLCAGKGSMFPEISHHSHPVTVAEAQI